MAELLTTRQVGDELGIPEWTVRRLVDALSPPVARFGLKRAIPRERMGELRDVLRQRRHEAIKEGNPL